VVVVTDALAVVAPFDRDPVVAARRAFDRRTGKPVEPGRLATYRPVLAQYHLHPEAKFRNAEYLDAGPTLRRHVRPRGPIGHIGKEANRWEEQFHLGANPEAQITYGSPDEELGTYRHAVAERAVRFSVRAIAETAGVSIGTVSAVRRGLGNPGHETVAAIDRAVGVLEAEADAAPGDAWPRQDDR
jgi:transcriptional regulator with XRE-family HTH domain